MNGEFDGKVAIVTGASSGICRVTLTSFVQAGARGVIADIDDEWGERLAAQLRNDGGDATFIHTDVTDSASVNGLVAQTVATHGGVDILVNCAGVGVHKSVVDMTDNEWDFQVDTQLRAVFLTCRAAGRQMIAQGRGGRIVNFGSTAAAIARVRAAPHCASKAAVVQFTKVLALELGQHKITVNVVAPGLTDIRKISKGGPNPDYVDRFVTEVPLGRLADPQEIADTVLFVASERSRFLTGQAIYVDGGYSAGKISIDGTHVTAYEPTGARRR